MSAGSPAGEDLSDEDRVLRCIEEHGENGISTFAITSDLRLSSKIIAPIVDRLEAEGRIHGEKRGLVHYWKPGAKPDDSRERVECPIEGCGAMVLADRGHLGSHFNITHGNLQPRDRSMMLDKIFPREGPSLEDLKAEFEANPDIVTTSYPEGTESIPCPVPGCGSRTTGKRARDNMFTHLKVKHGLEREEARKRYHLPWDSAPQEPGPEEGPKRKHTRGRPPKDPDARREPCPIEGCETVLAMTRDNVRHHLLRKHGLSKVKVQACVERLFPEQTGGNAEDPAGTEPAAAPEDEDPPEPPEEPVSTELPTKLPTDAPEAPQNTPELKEKLDSSEMVHVSEAREPECEGDSCIISYGSVPIAVMAPEPKPWSWPLDTCGGRAATLARDNPESEHYRRAEVQEDRRAWLLRTLQQLTDDAEARGLRVNVEASWNGRKVGAYVKIRDGDCWNRIVPALSRTLEEGERP